MKKSILNFTIFALVSSSILSSCNRKDKENDPMDDGTALVHSGDEAAFNEESDQIADDAGSSMEIALGSSKARLIGNRYSLCGADSVVVSRDFKEAVIYYNNTFSCDMKRKRTGTININLTGNSWADKNAVLTISTSNFKITRLRDGRSINLSGTHTITNISGGLITDLLSSSSPIIHSIEANNMSVTFEANGTTRTWNAKRTRTISKNATGVEIKIEGGFENNVSAFGTNRKGDTFTTSITEALIINSCNGLTKDAKWNVLSGTKVHNVNNKQITVTYGFNESKDRVGGCDANTIKVNYQGPRAEIESFYTYR